MTTTPSAEMVEYRVTGMDCPSCAAKIEAAAQQDPGVEAVRVSIASGILTLAVTTATETLPRVTQTIEALGYELARLDEDKPGKDAAHVTPAYRRALWIVVLLNVGYGIVEMVGGLLAGSQALKADALDFLGDGLITLLGLVAIGWSLTWRARSALMQGIFLGMLGVGVLANTMYRVIVLQTPDAELMGVLGAIALCVNVAAALVLIPHRKGDANVRAVWLFSRNDAIGNVAVVIAAVLVTWLNTPWPDLVVAAVIAALFLQSSWSIIQDARSDLRKASDKSLPSLPRS